jgi:hypothetical protein
MENRYSSRHLSCAPRLRARLAAKAGKAARKLSPLFHALAVAALFPSAHAEAPLRMNQVQVIGTHNSYHIAPDPKVIQAAALFDSGAKGWDYTHPPLSEQLDAGVRSFEIDLNYMDGTIYVFHVPHLDQGSTCPLFTECLATVLGWSEAHPGHVPITLLIEIKEDYAQWHKGVSAWDGTQLDQFDSEIRSVIPREKLITPDDVRGDYKTLEEGVLAGNWPTLEDARGKIMIALHEDGRLRDLYLEGRPSAEGRATFPRSKPGAPYAAFIVADDPHAPEIPEWVMAGYYVRTRADSGFRRDRSITDPRVVKALECGAQIVSTDHPPRKTAEKDAHVVSFEGAGFRCNPVNASAPCPALEP